MIKIITTEDGSQSLYNEQLNETYHSTHGALTESKHIFIKHGLDYLKNLRKDQVHILEIGFGTGLNALLTQVYALKNDGVHIEYVTLEPYPVSSNIIVDLKYHEMLKGQVSRSDFDELHSCSWGERHGLMGNFAFSKHQTKIQNFQTTDHFDLVFYDAFAPSKQAEMWELDVLQRTIDLMSKGAVLVTYCARGQFKRDLKALGLVVETLEGPPGKKEMVRAIKP